MFLKCLGSFLLHQQGDSRLSFRMYAGNNRFETRPERCAVIHSFRLSLKANSVYSTWKFVRRITSIKFLIHYSLSVHNFPKWQHHLILMANQIHSSSTSPRITLLSTIITSTNFGPFFMGFIHDTDYRNHHSYFPRFYTVPPINNKLIPQIGYDLLFRIFITDDDFSILKWA